MLKKFANSQGIRVYKNYLGNKWVKSSSSKIYDIKNPATNETVASVPLSNI